jgi:hypothetical protein
MWPVVLTVSRGRLTILLGGSDSEPQTERKMLEFYVNYTINTQAVPKAVQVGPYRTVEMARRQRQGIENTTGISHCWVGVSRDEAKQLLEADTPRVMQFNIPAAIPTAA